MASQTRYISCRQDDILSPRSWKVTIIGDGADRPVKLRDPFESDETEGLVRWYLEDFTNEPFAKVRAQGVTEQLRSYGSLLWEQLAISAECSPDTTITIDLSIVLTPGQPEIDRLHWELLETLSTPSCRIIVHRELRNDNSGTDIIPLPRHGKSVEAISGVFRILVVSARSNVRADVTPRLTSLPLLQTLGENRQVELIFTHSGTFDEFEKAMDRKGASNPIHLVHFDMHGRVDRNKGPVLEFTDPALKHRAAHSASTVAQVLQRNGVKWAVLCACRTAQTTRSAFSHLALQFLSCGLTGVFAMRYELKATAAKILTSSFYSALCVWGKTFIEAAYAARHQMRKDTSRLAKFGEVVEMDDSLVPALYTIDGADFRLDSSLENRPQGLSDKPWLPPEIIGREYDIRRIGSLLRGDTSFLVLKGDIGTGKSLLMRHLAWWWTETRLFEQVMHVNVSLTDADADGIDDVGLMRVAKCIWRSVTGNTNTASSDHNNPIAYLVEAMNTIKGQDSVILLDGLDELYHVSSVSEDTTEAWSNFFRVAKLLSTTSSKLLITTCAPHLCTDGGPSDDIFAMSRTMSTEDARRLVSSFQLQAQEGGQLDEPPDSHLLRVFDVLQYNPMVLKTQSDVLREKFHGLERILAWNTPSGDDSAEGTLYMQESVRRLVDLSTLDLEDSQGLGRVHFLMLTILNYLARHDRYQDILAVISIGLWTHTMPHPDAMRGRFASVTPILQVNTDLLHTLVDGISRSQLASSTIPLELWLVMKEGPPIPTAPAFSAEGFVESVKHVLPLLAAAKLLTEPTEPLVDGRRGWYTHPALTLWLRRVLRALPLNSLFLGFAQCIEDRAALMTGLNPSVTEHVAAIRSPSFPFIQREHWNLMTAFVGTFQLWRVTRSAISLLPSAARAQLQIPTGSIFAWKSFAVLAPICATTEDFCTNFLTHAALDYIDAVAPEVSGDLDRELNEPLGPLLYLVNWAIDMAQRYSLTDRQALPLRIRRLLLARVDRMRAAGLGADQLSEPNFVAAEFKALVSELRIAARAPDTTEADVDRWAERLERLRQGPVDAWGLAGRAIDDILSIRSILNQTSGPVTQESIREWRQERTRRAREAAAAAHGASTEDHDDLLATQNMVIDSLVDDIILPFASLQGIQDTGNPMHASLLFDLIRFMEDDVDYATGTPPWYMDLVTPIFTHTRDGNLVLAAAAARRALATADRDGHVLLAAKFRRICRWLGEMDASGDNYEVCRALLVRAAAFATPFLRDLLVKYLAAHDTPGAYQHAVQARDEMRLSMGLFQILGLLQETRQGDGGEGAGEPLHPFATGALANMPQLRVSLEGLERLVRLLAPHKDERLEDRGEWVHLVGEIRRLLKELGDESRTMDMTWVLETRSMLNDPVQFANLTNELLGGLETESSE